MLTYFNNLTNYFDNNSVILKLSYSLYSRFRGNIHYYLPYGEFSATKITDNLYVGDIHSSYQMEHLKNEGITHIVSCVMGSTPGYPDDFKYLVVNVIDNENQKIAIITPDKELFSGEVSSVVLPGTDGLIGVLKDHAPMVTSLKEGQIKVNLEKEEKFFDVNGGVVEVLKNNVIILAT